jgi:hypothetical protein
MMEQQVGNFKRTIMFKPGFDWRAEESSRNYGIGSTRIWFVLTGEKGAVQWQIGTDWYPESARRHLMNFSTKPAPNKPQGWDLGYHSRTPMYEDHSAMECDTLPEGKCYYDGSCLSADLLVEGFLNGGDDWVWNRLEAYYAHVFGNADFPNFDPIIIPHPDERPALS